jgi:PAS domain S-box-containing protein
VPAGASVNFESFLNAIHVDDRATVQAAINRALDSNGFGAFSSEFRVIGIQDGIERWISGTGQTVFQNGRASRFVGTTLDRTPHRHAEEALRASEERFRSLTQALPSIVFECDARGANVFTSDRWSDYTGMTPSASLGKGWMQAVHPEDLDASKRVWRKALQDGDSCQVRHRLRAADGSYRWFMVHALPRRDGDGQIVRWAGSCTDIDDLVRAEAALTGANRHKDEFLAMLAHELRNPLAPIRNAVYVLRKSNDDGLATKERNLSLLTIIERQVDHLVCLVDDLLDVSRVTHGKIHLRRERVDLCEILRHALDTSQPAIQAAGHQLVVELPSLPVIVDADRVRLGQIFANLLNNAAKYTPNDGQICLEAWLSGNEAVVRVRDNGIGIHPDMLPHVFDIFTQGANVEGRTQSGLGIGLTLVRRLAHLHGGRVEARSDGLGRGSEFIVHMPVAMVSQSKPETVPEPTSVAPRRVLVIDDDHDIADSLTLLLRLFGCDVRTTYDGFAGILTLVEFEPEIVLLDLGMPGMNGYETARRVRELPEGRDLLLVAVTGWSQDGVRERTLEAGFDLHLTKPASIDVVESLLGRKGDA